MFKKVVVGVDPTHEEEAAGAIHQALRLLEEGGQLFLVTAVDHPGGPGFFPVILDDTEVQDLGQEAERQQKVLVRKHVPIGIDVDGRVGQGAAGRVIVNEGSDLGADLLVVVEHGHHWPLVRDTVNHVVAHARCPVLVVPREADVV